MGCAYSSRNPSPPPPSIPLTKNSCSSSSSAFRSIVVHHPPLHPGDSSHLVSLVSSTLAMDAAKKSKQQQQQQPQLVLFTTSLRGIRRTYEDCCALRSLLRALNLCVDERDVSMDSSFRRRLQSLLPDLSPLTLPHLFLGDRHLGGADEVRQLHENGQLEKLLEGAPRLRSPAHVCPLCGGARFLPCGACSGSRKVFDEDRGTVARCRDCNENGLVRCPLCCCQ